ncbi:unnamed protein product [Alopecurus aequalis]
MSALRHSVGLALRRSAHASRLLGSGNTTAGLALRRPARLSHPPPSAASSRFLATGESSCATRQVEKRVAEAKGKLENVRTHCNCKGSYALAAAKLKVEPNRAPPKFQGRRTGSENTKRRSRKQVVRDATVSSGSGGRRKYRNHKDFLDRVVAPVAFCCLLLHILCTVK